MPQPPSNAIEVASRFSRHLRRLFEARPQLAEETAAGIAAPLSRRQLEEWLAKPPLTESPLTEDNLKPALRRLKQRAFAHICVRDLACQAPLDEVTHSMTLLAETTVTAALEVLHKSLVSRYGEPRNAKGEAQRLIVVGMGKLGGGELNVSSDIDLIFVYPEDGETDGSRSVSNFEFFSRLGRQLIAAIGEITADGQVFRVDMRLRPNGDSGPLVCSFEMLENYFITQGREWERYAWIKARPMTGARWEELESLRRPFVFRKYLDFGAINAMRDLHAQIRREVAKKDMAGNVKLGPGGIREIEFLAQVFQLIRGGRDLGLQIKPTLAVLARLVEKGIITADTRDALSIAYDFLRRLEHRLQYLDDAQTHHLPGNAEDQLLVAKAMGFDSYDAMMQVLDSHRTIVSRHFDEVFSDPNRDGHSLDNLWRQADSPDQCGDALENLGFRQVPDATQRLCALRQSGRYQQMPAGIRERFDALIPRAIEAAAATSHPDDTLARLLDLLETISRRAAYLALLQQYPQALQKVAELTASSAWAAQYLQQHPILLDELLDPRLLEASHDWSTFRADLHQRLTEAAPDAERQMDLLREAHHAQIFRLLSQDVSGLLPLEKLSDHLSELADIIVGLALEFAWQQVLTRHRETPKFAVISYGKLGGKELGYSSDLDMVFVYEDDDPDAERAYSRLSTRLNTWLSAQTPAGQLFETDLRLRPNGESGLVVVTLEGFRQYQLENAWVWEHQALTRARFSAGDKAIGDKFEQIRIEILRQQRDMAKLKEEVLSMRQRMIDNHGTKGDEQEIKFDLKQDPGGLIDVEFIIQYLILGHAHDHPELCGNLGNIALLRIAAGLGLIPADLAEETRDAYREYRRLQHVLRLNNQKSIVPRDSVASQIDAVRRLWRVVFGD